jgi:hypothetical protein
VEVKERLTREWRADCWKRLNPQMYAAQKRMADLGSGYVLGTVGEVWASCINLIFENPNSISLFQVSMREQIEHLLNSGQLDDEIRLRMEKEMEDIEFRLKRGSELGRFDQFWDDDILFNCRYSRSKWLHLRQDAPLETYSHALKRNKNFIHITFSRNSDVNRFRISDFPWVTSISWSSFGLPAISPDIHHEPLFIKSTNNDLITFAKEIRPKLDPISTYIFTDTDYD